MRRDVAVEARHGAREVRDATPRSRRTACRASPPRAPPTGSRCREHPGPHQRVQGGATASAISALIGSHLRANAARERCRRDFTVPSGTSSRSADLRLTEPFEVAQHQDGPLLGRQVGEDRAHVERGREIGRARRPGPRSRSTSSSTTGSRRRATRTASRVAMRRAQPMSARGSRKVPMRRRMTINDSCNASSPASSAIAPQTGRDQRGRRRARAPPSRSDHRAGPAGRRRPGSRGADQPGGGGTPTPGRAELAHRVERGVVRHLRQEPRRGDAVVDQPHARALADRRDGRARC